MWPSFEQMRPPFPLGGELGVNSSVQEGTLECYLGLFFFCPQSSPFTSEGPLMVTNPPTWVAKAVLSGVSSGTPGLIVKLAFSVEN